MCRIYCKYIRLYVTGFFTSKCPFVRTLEICSFIFINIVINLFGLFVNTILVYFMKVSVYMNDLATYVDDFINSKGIKKTWIADQLNISQQLLQKTLNKKNFTVDDANRILKTFGYYIDFNAKPI